MHSYSGAADDPDSWIVPELLIRFIRATNELNRCEPRGAGGLPVQQIRALLYLVRHDGHTIKELAQALSVSEARASRLADELAESGHIVSQRDVSDRRQVRLHVTPAAAEKAQRIYRERSGAVQAALSDASEGDVAVFAHLLRRLVEEFEALTLRNATEGHPVFDDHGDLLQGPAPLSGADTPVHPA